MKAEFYIYNDSFSWNAVDEDDDVRQKIFSFCDVADQIHRFKDKNELFVNYDDGFVSTKVCSSGITLSSLIWNRELGKSFLSRDLYNRLLNAFQNFAKGTSMLKDDLMLLLQMDNDKCCHAILVLNRIEEIPDNWQVVSTIKEWVDYRRRCLKEYPETGANYLAECEMCFPRLVIHKDNEASLNSLISTHVSEITRCLSVLNDCFFSDLKAFNGSHTDFLSHFGSAHKLDGSSFEGSGDKKFYKVFSDNIKHYCEPHLKMYHNDKGEVNCHCRVYFEFPPSNSTQIYVGYICTHL